MSMQHRLPDPVVPADSPGPALRNYGTAELSAAIQALEARGNRIHEGVHQARYLREAHHLGRRRKKVDSIRAQRCTWQPFNAC